jgi:hypothetical protein
VGRRRSKPPSDEGARAADGAARAAETAVARRGPRDDDDDDENGSSGGTRDDKTATGDALVRDDPGDERVAARDEALLGVGEVRRLTQQRARHRERECRQPPSPCDRPLEGVRALNG